ncbi:MAG: NAD-dependent epimerase/dehydratase family protein [bacterium]
MEHISENKKILVTGGTGYVGAKLVTALLDEGCFVYILSRKKSPLFENNDRVSFIIADITDSFEIPNDVRIIYHCAGSIYNTEELERVNVLGTKNIVAQAMKNNCTLIYLSSAGITGQTKDKIVTEETIPHPHNAYGRSKYRAEQVVVQAIKQGLKAHILRPSTIFGTGNNKEGGSFLQLIQSMRSGLYKNIGTGYYNIVHINEVIRALELLGKTDSSFGNIYILSNAVAYKKMDEIVKNATPKITRKTYTIPYFIAFGISTVLLVVCFILRKKNPLTFARLKALTNQSILSQEKIEKTIGFKNILSIEEHIKNTCEEYIKLGTVK